MNVFVSTVRAPRGRVQSSASALCGLLILVSACVAHASVRVESMQMPAWLERQGDIQPLNPGVALRDGDILRTGEQSRVVLRLEEGSQVKLGEKARFTVARVAPTSMIFASHRVRAMASSSEPRNSMAPPRTTRALDVSLIEPPS